MDRMRLPEHLKMGIANADDPQNKKIRTILKEHKLNTVCDAARCPNKKECYCSGSATFMIMGNICTRNCRFCNIEEGAKNAMAAPDKNEPKNIAKAVNELALEYCVITSVTRDDLPDGGAGHFARTISEIKKLNKDIKIEVLTPDFRGDKNALNIVLSAKADVFNHNVETVEPLYPKAREMANYRQSLEVLRYAKERSPQTVTKTGLMVGLGENKKELLKCFRDIKAAGCDILTIGQYICPSKNHLRVEKYYATEEFDALRQAALKVGIPYCISAPLARSSYMAKEAFGEISTKVFNRTN